MITLGILSLQIIKSFLSTEGHSEDESAQAKMHWTLPAIHGAKWLPAKPVASAKPEG